MSIQTSIKLNSKFSIQVSLARRNLLEDIPRFLVAQAGIMFAVSLVTIQTGLQKGFTLSASKLIDQSRADIWVTAKNQVHLGLTTPLNLQQKKMPNP
jgi:putative ABC transport system permease protein